MPQKEEYATMKIIGRLAGMSLAAAFAIMLSPHVQAAPVSYSQGPAEIIASDGTIVKAVTAAGAVHRSARRTARRTTRRHY